MSNLIFLFIDTAQTNFFNNFGPSKSDSILDFLKDILLPILLIIIGAIFGYGLDRWKKHKTFIEIRKYFFYSLYTLKVAVTKQIKNHNNYVSALKTKDNTIPTFELDPGFSLRGISVVKNEDLFKIFYEKGNEADKSSIFDLSNLLNSFEVIQSIIDNSEKETLYSHTSIDSRLTRFNDLFNKLREEIFQLQTFEQTPETPLMNSLIDEINVLGNEFQTWKDVNKKNDKNINIYEQVEYLVLPLKSIVAKYNYVDMLGYILDIEQTLYELDGNKENFSKKFNSDKNSLIEIKTHIIKLLSANKKYLNEIILENDPDLNPEGKMELKEQIRLVSNQDSLLHYTISFDNLVSILKTGLRYSISIEELPFKGYPGSIGYGLNVVNYSQKSNVICFCDIPFRDIDEHSNQYGKYALGLDKKWCMNKGITPVRYFHYDTTDLEGHGLQDGLVFMSAFANKIQPVQMIIDELKRHHLLRNDFTINDVETLPKEAKEIIQMFNREYINAMGYLTQQLDYLRAYEGDWIDRTTNEKTIRKFFYEHEWRATTLKSDTPNLKFEYSDITYLIVTTEEEKKELLNLGMEEIKDKIFLLSELQ